MSPRGLDEESKDYVSLYLLLVSCANKNEVSTTYEYGQGIQRFRNLT